jgi:hypothetical protein
MIMDARKSHYVRRAFAEFDHVGALAYRHQAGVGRISPEGRESERRSGSSKKVKPDAKLGIIPVVILAHHPAFGPGNDRTVSLRSGVRKVSDLRAIGYWRGPEDPFLPDARAFVDPSWDANERDAVIAYLRKGEVAVGWCGSSLCRFDCAVDPSSPAVVDLKTAVPDADVGRLARVVFSKENMGLNDLTDGTFIWPEGFAHYLEKHAVRPPEEFVKHVLSRAG